ncbi:MAG: DMT family transporter [Bryobacteraceae bacterium]
MSSNTQLERKRAPARWQADLTLAFVAFMWGTTFVVIKNALADSSTVYFLALRFAIGTVCMLPLFLRGIRSMREPWWSGLGSGAAAGVFLWLGFMLQTFGLRFTTASHSGFLTSLYIVGVPIVSAILYRNWPGRYELGGVALAGAGIMWLTKPPGTEPFHLNGGDLLTIASAVAFAFHIVVLGHVAQKERVAAVAIGQIGCAALLSTLSLPFEPPQVKWSNNVIWGLLITGVLATAAAFGLQTWVQKYTSATRAALIFSLEPVFAVLTATAVGGEPLTLGTLGGGALILTGILCVELKPGSKAVDAEAAD